MNCPCFRIFQAGRSGRVHFHPRKGPWNCSQTISSRRVGPFRMDPKHQGIKGFNTGHVETGGQKQIAANYTQKKLALLCSGWWCLMIDLQNKHKEGSPVGIGMVELLQFDSWNITKYVYDNIHVLYINLKTTYYVHTDTILWYTVYGKDISSISSGNSFAWWCFGAVVSRKTHHI